MVRNGDTRQRTAALALAFCAGAVLGFGAAVACNPDMASVRHGLTARARRLTREAALLRRRVNDRAASMTDQGSELAKRVRTAAREGVREARRHLVAVQEPPRAGLTGVEGLAEGF